MKGFLLKALLSLFCCLLLTNLFASDDVLFREASKLKAQGEYAKANYYYFKALSENVNTEEALYELSDSLYSTNDYKTSLDKIEQLLIIHPGRTDAMLLKSKIYIHQKKYEGALAVLKYLESNAPSSSVYALLDNVYSLLGDKASAIKAKRKHDELILKEQGQ